MENIDILTISEAKIDNTFTKNQFLIIGFETPNRYDRNGKGGGILIYFWEGVDRPLTDHQLPNDVEVGVIDITLKKKKWLMVSVYRPPCQCDNYFSTKLGCF